MANSGGESVVLASGNLTTGNLAAVGVRGGRYCVTVAGTGIDGNNTVSIQVKDAAGNWVQEGSTLSASGATIFDFPPGQIRAVVVGNITTAYAAATQVPLE